MVLFQVPRVVQAILLGKGTKVDEEEVGVRGGTISGYGKSAVEVSETGCEILQGVEYAGGK